MNGEKGRPESQAVPVDSGLHSLQKQYTTEAERMWMDAVIERIEYQYRNTAAIHLLPAIFETLVKCEDIRYEARMSDMREERPLSDRGVCDLEARPQKAESHEP